MKGFNKFFIRKFQGRLLSLLPTEGNAEIELLFADKK